VISHTFTSARNSDLTTSIAFRLPVTGRIPKGKRRSDAYQLHAISWLKTEINPLNPLLPFKISIRSQREYGRGYCCSEVPYAWSQATRAPWQGVQGRVHVQFLHSRIHRGTLHQFEDFSGKCKCWFSSQLSKSLEVPRGLVANTRRNKGIVPHFLYWCCS